ncbi:insulin degrading enzyme [Homo sapiens]|uniref:Insulin degrading enzyme n=1 Tax=Homo sapiens TaxID=9606 RepID=R4GN65_HUMAN|nr:insulin degrading enzyme [Homo sapiens]KAI4076818.1 insulin degrading enzyme [Homo sapiens]
MRYRLAWLLHPALPSTFRSVLGARLPPPERLCGNYQVVFQSSGTILHFHQQCVKIPISLYP